MGFTLSSASSWSFGSTFRFGGGGGGISRFEADAVSSALAGDSDVSGFGSGSVDEDGSTGVEFDDEEPESTFRSGGYVWNGLRSTRFRTK